MNGVLASELENAIRAYLDGSHGGDTVDRLDRIEDRLDEIGDAVLDGEGEAPSPSRAATKEKNFSESGKDDRSADESSDEPVVAEADGGIRVDDRHLYEDDEDDDRSAVERRTDGAVAELVANNDAQFVLEDLDEAIEVGADVHSKPSIRDYRKRVLDRLGGKDELVLPATEDKPIDQQVFFTDVERARAERASILVTDEGETVEDAAREYDVPPETVREAIPVAKHGAILIRDDGYGLEAAADEVGTDPDRIREVLPDEVIEDAEDRDGRGERELQEDDVDDRDVPDDELRRLDRAERGDPLDDVENDLRSDEPVGLE